MDWIDKLERKCRWLRIRQLMNYVIGGTALVFLLDMLLPQSLVSMLSLDMAAVLKGQLWRLVTFVFVPATSSLFSLALSLYFYWMIGNTLEAQWGTFRFTLYYTIGVLGAILAALITGYAANTFINLSLFLAFAAIFPNYEILLFFILPVKMKYLAVADIVLYAWLFISGTASTRVSILFSLLNVLLFFGVPFVRDFIAHKEQRRVRRNFRKTMRQK